MIRKKLLFYICECDFPSTSAYSIHVAKMCDKLSKKYNVILVTPYSSINFSGLKNVYNIKNKFHVLSTFKKKKNLNFINKFIFIIRLFFFLNNKKYKNQKKIIFSRSIISSLSLSLFDFKNILELHHELKGFSKFFYNLIRLFKYFDNIKFIIINRNLKKLLNLKQALILDDAVDVEQFEKFKNKNKKFKLTCLYVGSFHKGKGLEQLIELAELCPEIKFHVYGDKKFLPENIKKTYLKNLKIFDFINYSKIPDLLNQYEVVLMPLQKKNFGRGNIDISNSTSPMKMFDYLASGKIIIASKLKIYNHILVDRYNCILVDPENLKEWKKKIYYAFNNLIKNKKLKINAKKTAKKFTWDLRVKKIEDKYFKEFSN